MPRALSPEQARRFYDRFGKLQDTQAFYEDKAVGIALEHGRLDEAGAIFELGCGTGRHAAELLSRAPEARYLGVDVSARMVELATDRLEPFSRARIERSEGAMQTDEPDASFDRFVSTYVLDLLSEVDIHAALDEAARLLEPEGLLCLVSLGERAGGVSGVICGLWSRVHALSPAIVGGCRPLQLKPYLDDKPFDLVHHEVVTAFGVPSEIVVASRRRGSR